MGAVAARCAAAEGGSCDDQQAASRSWRQQQGDLIACGPTKSTGGRALV